METFLSIIYRLGGGLLFLVLGVFSVFGTSATAQAGRYIPTIWVDPDGCEHWVSDDGIEGHIEARRYPDGGTVCDPSLVHNYVDNAFKAGGTAVTGDPI
jgi:hypothetical protein